MNELLDAIKNFGLPTGLTLAAVIGLWRWYVARTRRLDDVVDRYVQSLERQLETLHREIQTVLEQRKYGLPERTPRSGEGL
jgi:hypothetical protein